MPQAVIAAAGAVGTWFGGLGFWGQLAVRLGASVALSAVSRKLAGKPGAPDMVRELQRPTELPPYRYAYGQTRVWGTWAPLRVKGDFIYGCLILNSRPSHQILNVQLDARDAGLTGNMHDFSGLGARATAGLLDGHFRCWVGLGDQTSPPAAILAAAPDLFETNDGWRGLTVMWVEINAGDNEDRGQRWPATPPVIAVDGKWSKVWDPRVPAQKVDDPATWSWSSNQALAALDALMRNPIQSYQAANLRLDEWIVAANVADEAVPLKGGGTEPRYRVNGVVVWDGDELIDQVQPLFDAGASQPARTGGQLGIIPGVWITPEYTLRDALDVGGIEVITMQPGRDTPNAVVGKYVSPSRGYELASLPPYRVPGALLADQGIERTVERTLNFVTSSSQAQRVIKIRALEAREQTGLSLVAPPDALDVVAGSAVTVALPAPLGRLNGTYRAASVQPGSSLTGDDGEVALNVPMVLRQVSAATYAWSMSEQVTIENPGFDPDRAEVPAPAVPIITVGGAAALDTGDGQLARIGWRTPFPGSRAVTGIEWQYRLTGGEWRAGSYVARTAGEAVDYIAPVAVGRNYDLRVRSVASSGISAWVNVTTILAAPPDYALAPPLSPTADAGAGRITFAAQLPNDPAVRGMLIYAGPNQTSLSLVQSLLAGPNVRVTWTETGLPPGTLRYYRARTMGPYESQSAAMSVAAAATPT